MNGLPKRDSIDKRQQQYRDARVAMLLSLIVGVLMLAGKMSAFLLTGSSAIFSDAAESVVHVVAVAFAVFSLWLSARPAVAHFHYGYERITFFSAGFEGAMIVLAAGSIIYTTTEKWRHGLALENLGRGVVLIVAAGVLNAVLGMVSVAHRPAESFADSRGRRKARADR